MNMTKLVTVAAAAALAACGPKEPEPAAEIPTAQAPTLEPSDTLAMPAQAPAPRPRPAVAARPEGPSAVRRDIPFVTSDTGSIRPGMTEAQVAAVWGRPFARRTDGSFVYLYYRNGCEASCGIHDVVLLQGDQVVDAVVRFPGHSYAGVSSSPAGRTPRFTPPDTTGGP